MNDEDEIEVLKSVFEEFSEGSTGYLTQKQFINFINALSIHEKNLVTSDPYTINSVYKYLDKDGCNKLFFREVCNWWLSPKKYEFFSENSAKLINKANRLFSTHAKDARLTYEEFDELLQSLKVDHNESTFDEIDRNGDGLMSFNEFFDWLGWIKQ